MQIENNNHIPIQYPRPYRNDDYVFKRFTETTSPELVAGARQLHALGYEDMGFIYKDAIDDNGFLNSDIDHARGSTVEYYIGIEPSDKNQEDSPSIRTTLRKISIPSDGTLDDLPAYQLCRESLYPEEKAKLLSIDNPHKYIKEISALARSPETGPMATLEVLRDVLHESLGKNELWFFSMVNTTYDSLVESFGPKAIRQIGDAVKINNPLVPDHITLVPAVVEIDHFLFNISEAAMNSIDQFQQRKFLRSLEYFANGLRDQEMDDEVVITLELTRSNKRKVS